MADHRLVPKGEHRSLLLTNIYFPLTWNSAKQDLQNRCERENWGENLTILHNYITQLFAAIGNRYLEQVPPIDHGQYKDGIFFLK